MKNTIKKVLSCIGKYKYYLAASLLLSLVYVICTLYIPVLAGNAIDTLKDAEKINLLIVKYYVIKIAFLALLAAVVQWITNLLNNKIAFRTVEDLRSKAISKINRLPLSYIDKRPVGDIVSRIISDSDQIADGLLLGFTQFFTGIVTIAGTLIFMVKISLKITPVVVILTPLSLFVSRFIAKNTHSMFSAQSKARGTQTALIDEAVNNRKVISNYNYEKTVINDFDKVNDDFAKYSLKAIFFSSITNPSTRFVNNMIYAAVALTGALCAIGGSITIGGLTCFLSYAGQYAKPFNEISGVIAELQNALACAERLFEIIEAEPETDKSDNLPAKTEGSIELKDVSFSYDKNIKLIEGLNISAEKDSKIAIVGPTGCGKTTVINLLMRFYDTDSGSISIDSMNIADYSRKSLRNKYGMVLQETWIKSGTIKENIALGKPDATDDEIIEAAKSANAHSFIKRLPKGYDTVINDGDSDLSAGQKQLICIARVMLLMPPMLILDEATSSIDVRTELKIRKAFDKISKGKTSFIVAHRLSTIKNSDIILVMKDGKVIEQGNHNELLAQHGFYETLYNSRVY